MVPLSLKSFLSLSSVILNTLGIGGVNNKEVIYLQISEDFLLLNATL